MTGHLKCVSGFQNGVPGFPKWGTGFPNALFSEWCTQFPKSKKELSGNDTFGAP